MILVTGASGDFGSKTINFLLEKGISPDNITALIRDEEKGNVLKSKGINIKIGDYNDHQSLVDAFENVDKLLLISSNDRQAVENRTNQHKNVIRAAKEGKINTVIYTSFVRKTGFQNTAISEFQNSHLETEKYLKDSGLNYTILQNGIYLEMIPAFIGNSVADSGKIIFPSENVGASWVLKEELAEAAAQILTTDGHNGKTYVLTNTESVNFEQIAGYISTALGKKIDFISPEIEEFESTLKTAGVPDQYIGMMTMWGSAQAQGALDLKDSTLMELLDRRPTAVKTFIENIFRNR